MSGICGCIHFDERPVHPETLAAMAGAAAHRGPDGIQTWHNGRVALAHLALHVTPEDERETQPLATRRAERDLVLVADARIDNRADLQSALRAHLSTDAPTDADLVLAAYETWGADCARHLIGDFAFAIWDARHQLLFAARDPMGMRALYYRRKPHRFLFATEAKQILAAPGVPRKIHDPAVAAYLAANVNDRTQTFYEGIRLLPEAHSLRATATNLRTWRHWDADSNARLRYRSDEEYVEHFREVLTDAVRCRLHSTSPAGLLLSGGLDSGSIAALGGHLHEQGEPGLAPIRTYSWAFDTLPQCDERSISAPLVQRYGLSATDIEAESAPLLRLDPYLGPDSDDPYVGGFHGLMDRALQAARREGVRTVLTGHRGDLMAGLWLFDYLHLLKTGQWRRLVRELRQHEQRLGVPWRRVVEIYLTEPLRASLWPEDRLSALRNPLKRLYRAVVSPPASPGPFPDWVRSEFIERVSPLPDRAPTATQWRGMTRQKRYEGITMSIHMHVALSFERHAAQCGLTAADPWSDRRLVEFALAVPPDVLCRAGMNKWIVREAMRGVMPPNVLQASRKVNPYPLHERALKAHLRDLVSVVLSTPSLEKYIDEKRLQSHYGQFQQGQELDVRFWFAVTFALWLYRQHIPSDTRHLQA